MRILHLANGRLYGGIERMLATLAGSQALLRRVTFEFAVCHGGRLARELRGANAAVHGLGDVRLSRPATVLRARQLLRARLATGDYAAVVCHAPWAHALFGGVVRSQGAALVLWQHDRATGQPLIERAVRRIPAALVICNSEWTAASADVLQPGVARRVVHCPVVVAPPRAGRASVRASLDASDADVVVLSASRLDAWKGHLDLVRALATVPSPRWVLWVAGGAQRPEEARYLVGLQDLCRTLGIAGRVRFLGERQDVPDLMGGADLLAQANIEPEPFGIVFAEALLSGLPVVTSRMGGATEIVTESCGRLVTPGDRAALAQALSEMIDDGPLRALLGAAGPARAASVCDPGIVIPALEEALLAVSARAAA